MIANELHFTNPMSLILASSVLGTDLKRAKFIENEYFLNGGNHYNNQKNNIFKKWLKLRKSILILLNKRTEYQSL